MLFYVQMPKKYSHNLFRHPVVNVNTPVEAVSGFCDELPPLLK